MVPECRHNKSIAAQQGEGSKGRKWLQINSVSSRKGKPWQKKSRIVVTLMGVGGRDWWASISEHHDSRRGAISLTDTLLLLSRKGRSIFSVSACVRVCFEEHWYQPFFHTKKSTTAVSVVQPMTRLCYSHRAQPRQLIVTGMRFRTRKAAERLASVSWRNTLTAMIGRWSSFSTQNSYCSRGSNSLLAWHLFHH